MIYLFSLLPYILLEIKYNFLNPGNKVTETNNFRVRYERKDKKILALVHDYCQNCQIVAKY